MSTEATARANELYWSSDRSVNQIADDLDVSKGTLYTIIEPLDAGIGCPMCGASTVYPNRTAKDRGLVDCPDCEWDGRADEAVPDAGGGRGSRRSRTTPLRPPPAPAMVADTRVIVGGALLGAAAGLALVLWARRR